MSTQRPVSRIRLRSPTRERSLLMARVRRSGTACEVTLRKALHRAGYRYRLDSGSGLPGTPDLVLSRLRIAIFVDGCFWHGCPQHGTVPKTNTQFWTAKVQRNQQRDKQVGRSLKRLGWKVLRVWEHEVRLDMRRTLRRVKRLLES
jgi:DNA mismatch endonuclease (patch repair protein)